MIYIRDDDVLIKSSGWSDPFGRFKQIHEWICRSDRFIHVPTILKYNVKKDNALGILDFPEAISFIEKETKEGRMQPQIHGLEHINYAKLSTEDIILHLEECKEFIQKKFGVTATKWYTPWGANASHLYEAATSAGLQLIDCSNINELKGKYGIIQRLKEEEDISFLEEKEVFIHWWKGGARLLRLVEIVKHGSFKEAKKHNRELFR